MDLYTVKSSLIIHTAYDIANNNNSLLSVVLKAKYFHNSSFWTTNTSGPRSIFWSSIMQVKKELCNTTIFQIHAGKLIWSTPWCLIWGSIHDHLLLPVTTNPLPATISDLWFPNSQSWNLHLLTNTFDNEVVQAITSVRPVPSPQQDTLRWTPAKNGIRTPRRKSIGIWLLKTPSNCPNKVLGASSHRPIIS